MVSGEGIMLVWVEEWMHGEGGGGVFKAVGTGSRWEGDMYARELGMERRGGSIRGNRCAARMAVRGECMGGALHGQDG